MCQRFLVTKPYYPVTTLGQVCGSSEVVLFSGSVLVAVQLDHQSILVTGPNEHTFEQRFCIEVDTPLRSAMWGMHRSRRAAALGKLTFRVNADLAENSERSGLVVYESEQDGHGSPTVSADVLGGCLDRYAV